MRGFPGFVKATVVGGFFVILPVALILILLGEVYSVITAMLEPIVDLFPVDDIGGVPVAMVLSVLLLVALCLVAGLAVRTRAGAKANQWMEDTIFSQVPGYRAVRGLTRQLTGQQAEETFKPAVVQIEDEVYTLAFLVEEHGNGYCTVMIPNPPTAMAGPLRCVRTERVKRLDSSLGEVFDCLTYWGVGSGPLFKKGM